jgi:hypothetical protein
VKSVGLLAFMPVFLLISVFSSAAGQASPIPDASAKSMVAKLERFLRSQAWHLGICSP